jgi:hypothetical protein
MVLDMQRNRLRLAYGLDRTGHRFAADNLNVAQRQQLAHAVAEIGIHARG